MAGRKAPVGISTPGSDWQFRNSWVLLRVSISRGLIRWLKINNVCSDVDPSLSAKNIFINQGINELSAAICGSKHYSRFSTVLRASCSVSQCLMYPLAHLLVSEFREPQIPTHANNLQSSVAISW